jgi:hypothetical protein
MRRAAPHPIATPHRPARASAPPPERVRSRACLALGLALGLAALGPIPARATFMTPVYPLRPKECTLIRRGGTFHLFYTQGDRNAPFDSTWRDLGHATSTDLVHWTQSTPVLPRRPSNWDNFQIWAPHVIQRDATYYLFYTGVTHRPPQYDHHQRIGLATSTDLVNWTRLDRPVFDCTAVPWAFCVTGQIGGGDFRDPFVMADPDSAGRWLMYYTTRPAAAPGDFIIGVARSRGDFTQWQDAGPMWNAFATRTGSVVVETPDLIKHGSLWYFLYTTWLPHPVWFQTALSPIADSLAWSAPRSLYGEVIQVDTDPSFGPEHYSVDGHDLYLMPNSLYESIQLLEYQWKTPPHFDLVEPYTTLGRVDVADATDATAFALHARGGRAPVELWLDLPRPLGARGWVCDITGRRIRDLGDAPHPAGRSRVQWDGRDDRGDAVPSGVYLAVIETALGRRAGRFVLLR